MVARAPIADQPSGRVNNMASTDFSPEGSLPTREEEHLPHVLLVDDDAQVVKALSRVLGRFSQVTIASSVATAESHLSGESEYSLILCDLLLPERGGVDLYRKLREDGSGLADRVAFMTGLGDDALEGDEYSTVPCLGKPLNLERVRRLIRRG